MSQELDFRRYELLNCLYHCAIIFEKHKIIINAVMQICGTQQIGMGTMQLEGSIHGGQVNDLITKFFYKNDFLCFQVLLQMTGGERVLFGEFTDYSEYKKIFSDLQGARNSDALIDIPKNNLRNTSRAIKVA